MSGPSIFRGKKGTALEIGLSVSKRHDRVDRSIGRLKALVASTTKGSASHQYQGGMVWSHVASIRDLLFNVMIHVGWVDCSSRSPSHCNSPFWLSGGLHQGRQFTCIPLPLWRMHFVWSQLLGFSSLSVKTYYKLYCMYLLVHSKSRTFASLQYPFFAEPV